MIAGTKKHIAEQIQSHRNELWQWQLNHAQKAPPPFYCSIDLRDSGHKIVPVDSNLYPAGFNNICPEDLRAAAPLFKAQIETLCRQRGLPQARNILIIPESHTQNAHYIENLHFICEIIQNAGFELKIGWYPSLIEEMTSPLLLKSFTHKELWAHSIQIKDGIMSTKDFIPNIILLNNDFSGGYPKHLDSVIQPILPSHTLGWHSRKKSEHFTYYNQLAAEFASIIKIDPWLIQIDTEEVTPVNFSEEQGTEEVAQTVEKVLERTRKAYAHHNVNRKPFVFVKNNSGTYGMGIMVAHSSEELRNMNRRTKTKMSTGKNHSHISSVVVQEGIPTATLVDRLAAEPVIYLFGSALMGGFLRTNSQKNDEDNLNSQGMVFKKLCMSDLRTPDTDLSQDDQNEEPILELVYGSVAQLSALATGMELAQHARRNN